MTKDCPERKSKTVRVPLEKEIPEKHVFGQSVVSVWSERRRLKTPNISIKKIYPKKEIGTPAREEEMKEKSSRLLISKQQKFFL